MSRVDGLSVGFEDFLVQRRVRWTGPLFMSRTPESRSRGLLSLGSLVRFARRLLTSFFPRRFSFSSRQQCQPSAALVTALSTPSPSARQT